MVDSGLTNSHTTQVQLSSTLGDIGIHTTHSGLVFEEFLNHFHELVLLFWIKAVSNVMYASYNMCSREVGIQVTYLYSLGMAFAAVFLTYGDISVTDCNATHLT